MNKVFNILLISLLVSFSSTSFSQKLSPEGTSEYFFCIKLANGEAANLVRYAIIGINPRGKKTLYYLNRENWLWEFTGQRPSRANKDTLDFLRKYEISFKTVKNLWKIKFSEYPWHQKYTTNNAGWAGRAQAPSIKQMDFLKKYGIKKFITEPIYGEKLIQLLQDMQDEAWRTEYINLK
ncbi:MAG: hypothetical protein KAG99_03575 [Bacteroidales bacterium]|nr:hypothetical protein [Bacteroidales bacterium]